ncbi:MAG: helix-turn-helix domain-containing protein [Pedobacter sp.]|nr:MAG: helix-turn-helix domain-containing protein [Pedobacter sp.]
MKKLQSELDSQTRRMKELEEYVFEAQALVKDWVNVEFQRKRAIVESIIKQIMITERNIDIELSIDLQNVLHARKKSFGDLPNTPSLIFDKKLCKPLTGKYPQNPKTIGEHIRKKRIDSRLSQAQLAKVIGVSPDCITNWENNKSTPQILYYPRIRLFLGFDTTDFDETTFSGRLQSYRSRNGMSCKEMAKLLGVDKSTILAWEKGTNKPAGKIVEKIEELFRKSNGEIT